MKREEFCVVFSEELRRALGGQEVLPDNWTVTANVIWYTGDSRQESTRHDLWLESRQEVLGGGMRKCRSMYRERG